MHEDNIDVIRSSVSALQAARAMGIRADRNGRCACPVHNGADRNCKLDSGPKGFKCFVCGAHGDVIDLVQTVQGVTFRSAIEWLNSAFGLGLELGRPVDPKASEAAQIARKRRLAERERMKAIERAEFDVYVAAGILLNDLENDVKKYRPKHPYGPWDERFGQALRGAMEAREFVNNYAIHIMGKDAL